MTASDPPAPGSHSDVYLHIGMPKTATTSLQHFLFAEHSGIRYLGKRVRVRGAGFPEPAVRRFVRGALNGRSRLSGDDRDILRALAADARRDGQSLVLSEELLVSGTADAKRAQARLLRDIFPDCRVLMVVRRPLEFMESLYFQYLKGFNQKNLCYRVLREYLGEPPKFFDVNLWLELMWDHTKQPIREYLRYADNLDIYSDVLGQNNVRVVSFEQLQADSDAFIDELSENLDIDADESRRLFSGRRINERWSQAAVDRLQAVEKSWWLRRKFRRATRSKERNQLLGLTDENDVSDSTAARADISDEWRRYLLASAAPQWQRLSEEWGLPPAPLCDEELPDDLEPVPQPEHRERLKLRQQSVLLVKNRKQDATWAERAVDVASGLSFDAGNRFLHAAWSSRVLQRTLFRDARERMQTVATWIGRPLDLRTAICQHLFANDAKDWRLAAFGDFEAEETVRRCTISRLDILESLWNRRPGVLLLNSHFGAARLVKKVLVECGYQSSVIAAGERGTILGKVSCKVICTRTNTPFRVVKIACDDLEAGKAVFISADGEHGSGGVELPFLGKLRPFRTGFAQLAVKTGAPVVPMFAIVDERGGVQVRVLEPLTPPPEHLPKRDRIQLYAEQYARVLERVWIEEPGNIRTEQFQHHLDDYRAYRATDDGSSPQRRAA